MAKGSVFASFSLFCPFMFFSSYPFAPSPLSFRAQREISLLLVAWFDEISHLTA
jgi:hypothetical protein